MGATFPHGQQRFAGFYFPSVFSLMSSTPPARLATIATLPKRRVWQGLWTVCLWLSLVGGASGASREDLRPLIISSPYEPGFGLTAPVFVNDFIGWNFLISAGFTGSSSIVANVEAGHIWAGHEVFSRPDGWNVVLQHRLTGPGALDEEDYHATAVGHVLAGTGYLNGSFYYVGLGMAPDARLWSGAIATSYSTDPEQIGSFSITTESMLSVYRSFFQGIDGEQPDVINSSWGGEDAAAISSEAVTLDALAASHSTVALVVAAGNGGSGAPVGSPGSNYNALTIGSTGGEDWLAPSSFSSGGLVDFFNPATQETFTAVRVGVDLAAPGELFFLAAYLGSSGSLGAAQLDFLQNPSPTDLYFLEMSGTSFAAPMVAGGIALLKDAARRDLFFNLNGVPSAFDTRVLKAVMLASARPTLGWDNGQGLDGAGVIRTTQALDARMGAGLVQFDWAAEVYLLSDTRGLAGGGSTVISATGWLFGNVEVGGTADFAIFDLLPAGARMAVALSWFAGRQYQLDSGVGEDLSFADLNLQVWRREGTNFTSLVAESASLYNNTEFLRFDLAASGYYGLRVTFNGLIYDLTSSGIESADFGLAWDVVPAAIPEPRTLLLLVLAGLVLCRGVCPRESRIKG